MVEHRRVRPRRVIRAQPLIVVRNVRASARWYGRLLELESLPEHGPREICDRLFCAGDLIMQLHAWDEEHHPNSLTRTPQRPEMGPCFGSKNRLGPPRPTSCSVQLRSSSRAR
jgi:hypothetical protein